MQLWCTLINSTADGILEKNQGKPYRTSADLLRWMVAVRSGRLRLMLLLSLL
jgi:hypothetical protein